MIRHLALPLLALLLHATVAGSAFAERRPVDEALVRAAIETGWADRAVAGAELEILRLPKLVAPEGGGVRVCWPETAIPAGSRALTVECVHDGRVVARGLASVMIRRETPVWIVLHDLKRGDAVGAEDVRLSARTWERSSTRAVTGEMPSRGWIAARALTAGQWLRQADVKKRPDVTAGSKIRLLVRGGDASVWVTGRVRRAGSIGDTILVLNPITNKLVSARLLDAGTAELLTPGSGSTHSSEGSAS